MKTWTGISLIFIILISSVWITSVSAEQILNTQIIHAIVSNPVSVFGKTYPVLVENKTYNVYYGFHVTYASATNMFLTPDRDAIQIRLKDVTDDDAMWIQFPQNLVSSENNNFTLYVDGQERKYEFATSNHSIVMGFMVPKNVQLIEIQGSRSIPEFRMSAILIFALVTALSVTVTRKRIFKMI
ncbi:MAG: hypothetical protein KGH86_07910 [Thaumarchaeota archaeon]|nr:hypothetical protein [Nitrososphaerota archaeon]MDE1876732.1 hypothetical protein [Nitrososphaerota archaeon]